MSELDPGCGEAELPKARKRNFEIGVAFGVLLTFLGAASDIGAFAGFLGRAAPVLSEWTMGLALKNEWMRASLAADLLAEKFQEKLCNVRATPLDLDADGAKSDLFIEFAAPRPDGKGCWGDIPGDKEAAFYRWESTQYRFIGSPPYNDNELTYWTFVGPAALRTVVNSDWPPIEVYMLGADNLEHVGTIDTYNDAEDSWVRTKEVRGGALVHVPSGIWRVERGLDGLGTISPLKLQDIMPVDGHSRLLSYRLSVLSIDGNEVGMDLGAARMSGVHAASSKRAVVTLKQLDRLYLVGCRPGRGVKVHPSDFGAYTVNLALHPYVTCRTDEDDEEELTVWLQASNA